MGVPRQEFGKRTYGKPGRPHSPRNLQADFDAVKDLTSVGYLDDKPVYACMVEAAQIDVMKYMSGNLFALLGRTSQTQFDVIGRAYQLLNWERDHRHCGRCGAQTVLADKGQSRHCEPCRFSVYPRLSPCVIVLVSRDDEMLSLRALDRIVALQLPSGLCRAG